MMDERNSNDFNITLPEESEIRADIGHLHFILLTGEAGDGKSRILRNLSSVLEKEGFIIYEDFSAIQDERKSEIIEIIKQIKSGKSNKKIIVAANIGVFTKTMLIYDRELMKWLTSGDKKIKIVNFEKRNLAMDAEIFYNIIRDFLSYNQEEDCNNKECIFRENCVFKKNMQMLLSLNGMESIRVLCDTVYLTGGHKDEYIKARREAYFLENSDKYGKLFVDYLKEFKEVVEYINKNPIIGILYKTNILFCIN